MRSLPRILVVTPAEDGRRSGRYLHGGIRYRAIGDEILSAHGTVIHREWLQGLSPDERARSLDADLEDVDALVLAPWLMDLPTFDDERFQRTTKLRVIAGTFDYRLGWVDVVEAEHHGVHIVDTSRTMTPTVAEFGVGITLALLRDIPAAIQTVREGGWFDSPRAANRFIFRDLADCRVGLAGYGTINRHYRRFIAPFGSAVSAYDPLIADETLETDRIERSASLVELARASDIFVVAIPPTPTTLEVIDAGVIDALAPGSLFVLLSRMAVIDQKALWRRVQADELRAAIDVFDPEPPPSDAWFRRHPNVLPTPHIAGNVQFAHERCFREACADTARILAGDRPHHVATVRDRRLYVEGASPLR
jgi:D-3-phosphoglycerate dehydrogenase